MSIIDNLEQRHNKLLLSKKETAKELNISEATLDWSGNLNSYYL